MPNQPIDAELYKLLEPIFTKERVEYWIDVKFITLKGKSIRELFNEGKREQIIIFLSNMQTVKYID